MIEVSIIIPCRNEKAHISEVLDSILANDYPKDKLEVIVSDGMSEDGTRSIVEEYARKYDFIRLIDNPKKIAPTALNEGIRLARGKIIMRMDAHAIYPPDYISKLVSSLKKLDADNVGGMWETVPGGPGLKAKAIALALSHPFGVGNATYRLKNSNNDPIETDTVPFGCYRRDVFDRIGLFDEELSRNQDNELNERLKKCGGKIFLIPDVKIKYFARDSYSKLWKMFYQYGYYGPLVDKKLGRPTRIRRYIPSLFVLSLSVPSLVGLFYPKSFYISTFVLILYIFLCVMFSILLSIKMSNIFIGFALFLSFITSHVSYGIGYLCGAINFYKKK